MRQVTFVDAEHSGRRKQIRNELFLIGLDQVPPWKGLIGLMRAALS